MPSTLATVRAACKRLRGVEEGTAYGAPAWKLRGRLMTCVATNKAAEPGSLVVCLDLAQRDELIAAEPETYYLKDHYVDYPCVLVRLRHIRPDALRDLLLMAWKFAGTGVKRRR